MSLKTDPRVDAYIAKAPVFARPILLQLRRLAHANCPGVEETMKWSHPSFQVSGRILCGIAAFKEHCKLGFWHPEVSALVERELQKADDAGGQFGRLTTVDDLPEEKTMQRYFAEAYRLARDGKPARSRPASVPRKPAAEVPDDLAARLRQNAKARAAFEAFSPSHRREYIEWITEAKREETRSKRLDETLVLLAEGKSRHWKYQNCGTGAAPAA